MLLAVLSDECIGRSVAALAGGHNGGMPQGIHDAAAAAWCMLWGGGPGYRLRRGGAWLGLRTTRACGTRHFP